MSTNEKFHVENDVIITTKDAITVEEVSNYLKENFNNFKLGSEFVILCGIHGSKDGAMGRFDYDLVDDYRGMFERFLVAKHFQAQAKVIKEREYQMGNVVTVFSKADKNREGRYVLYESSKERIKIEFERVANAQKPIVLILASCWSFRSEISNILRSTGLYAALNISEDRGKITTGKMFTLTNEQQNLLKQITEHPEIKDVIIFGELITYHIY